MLAVDNATMNPQKSRSKEPKSLPKSQRKGSAASRCDNDITIPNKTDQSARSDNVSHTRLRRQIAMQPPVQEINEKRSFGIKVVNRNSMPGPFELERTIKKIGRNLSRPSSFQPSLPTADIDKANSHAETISLNKKELEPRRIFRKMRVRRGFQSSIFRGSV